MGVECCVCCERWVGDRWFMVDKNGGGILVDMMCVGECRME